MRVAFVIRVRIPMLTLGDFLGVTEDLKLV